MKNLNSVHIVFIIILLFLNVSFSQYYQYMNISESDEYSTLPVIVVDSHDNFSTAWIDDNNKVSYRYARNKVWSETQTIYESRLNETIYNINTEMIYDTCFVFFSEIENDSSHLVRIKLNEETVEAIDTLYTFLGEILYMRTAASDNQISIGLLDDTTPQVSDSKIYVIQYPDMKRMMLKDSLEFTKFSLAYDKSDTLWFFLVDYNMLRNSFLDPVSLEWSEWIPGAAYEDMRDVPINDIDCKYNNIQNCFNIALTEYHPTGDEYINGLLYTQGYGSSWTNFEYIIEGKGLVMSGGEVDYPQLEISSLGERHIFYKYYFYYLEGPWEDERTIKLAEKKISSDTWSKRTVVDIGDYVYSLNASAINSKDSLYCAYSKKDDNQISDVYLAGSDNPSYIREEQKNEVAQQFTLLPAYPNPFNSSVVFPFNLNAPGKVSLRIFDLSGRLVYQKTVELTYRNKYKFSWYGKTNRKTDASSGIYFYQFYFNDLSDATSQSGKIILIR